MAALIKNMGSFYVMGQEEIKQFIRDNYILMTDKQLAEHLPINARTVHKKRQRMGLESPNRNYYLHSLPVLRVAAECYELWINGMAPKDIGKIVKLSVPTILKNISRFLPVDKSKGKVIVMKSKV